MQSGYKKLLIGAAVLIVVILIIQYTGIIQYCSLASLQQHSEYLRCFVEQRYLLAVLTYIGVYAAFIAASIPCVGPLSLVGGYLFGFFWAVLYSVFAATIGSSISFYLLRTMYSHMHDVRLTPRLAYLKAQLDRYGYVYLLVLQFLVVVPFLIINTLAVIANVSWRTFLWTTILGVLPAAMIYSFAGKQLTKIQSAGDFFTWPIIISLALLIVITLLPLIVRRFKMQSHETIHKP